MTGGMYVQSETTTSKTSLIQELAAIFTAILPVRAN